MPFNLTQFQSEIGKRGGFAKASNFEIEVTGPPGALVGGGRQITMSAGYNVKDIERSITFRASAVDFPGRGVGIVPFSTYGAPYQMGTDINYIPVTLTILLSPNLIERDYFLGWQDLIGGNHRAVYRDGGNQGSSFDIGYYQDYAQGTQIKIKQFGENNIVTHTTSLLQCWPSFVGNITGSWEDDGFQKMQVTMTYKQFIDEYSQIEISQPEPAAMFQERFQNQLEYQSTVGTASFSASRQIQNVRGGYESNVNIFSGGLTLYQTTGQSVGLSEWTGNVRSLMYKAARIRNT